MKSVIMVLLLIVLSSLVVFADGPIIPDAPALPTEPEITVGLALSTLPSPVLVTSLVTFRADYYYDNDVIDDAVCTLSINTQEHTMVYDGVQYYEFTSTDSFIMGVEQSYNVTCTSPSINNSERTAQGSFIPQADPSLLLTVGVSPSPSFSDQNLTFYAEFSDQGTPITNTDCGFVMGEINGDMTYVAGNQRYEFEVLEENLPAPGVIPYTVSCVYPANGFVAMNQSSVELLNREDARLLSIWHSPASPKTNDNILVFANYTTGHGVPINDTCQMKFYVRDFINMTFNVTGDTFHRAPVANPSSGTYSYNVSCNDDWLTGWMSITTPSSSGGGGGYVPPQLACIPDWSCGDWDECSMGIQMRTCTDINNCGVEDDRPVTVQSCEEVQDANDDDPDLSLVKPQFVRQPLIVTPGEPTEIILFNDGLELFNDLTITVGETSVLFADSLHPGDRKSVFVSLPLNVVLVQNNLSVKLLYNDVELDSGILAVDVQWPPYGVYLDAHQDAKFYVVIDNSENAIDRSGLEVMVKLFHEGGEIYMDYLGPYSVGANQHLVRSVPVPSHYLREGDVELRATFYEQGEVVAETAGFFSSTLTGGFNPLPLFVILLVALGIVVLFFGFDMVYNKRSLSEEFTSLSGSRGKERK